MKRIFDGYRQMQFLIKTAVQKNIHLGDIGIYGISLELVFPLASYLRYDLRDHVISYDLEYSMIV